MERNGSYLSATSPSFSLENLQLPKNKNCKGMKAETVINLLRSALFGAAFIGFLPSLVELEAALRVLRDGHRASN